MNTWYLTFIRRRYRKIGKYRSFRLPDILLPKHSLRDTRFQVVDCLHVGGCRYTCFFHKKEKTTSQQQSLPCPNEQSYPVEWDFCNELIFFIKKIKMFLLLNLIGTVYTYGQYTHTKLANIYSEGGGKNHSFAFVFSFPKYAFPVGRGKKRACFCTYVLPQMSGGGNLGGLETPTL